MTRMLPLWVRVEVIEVKSQQMEGGKVVMEEE
jgi:hypothetical protein